jgi:hypothetical protein
MQELNSFINVLSQILTVIIALGGFLGFVLRKQIGAWIDSRFKVKVGTELKQIEHNHTLELEKIKQEQAKELIKISEGLKADLALDLERKKRELDEEFRMKTRFFDANSSFYETFQTGYTSILTELYALDGEHMDALNSVQPSFGKAVRDSYLKKAHRSLIALNEELTKLQSYLDSHRNLQISKLFADLSKFMADGAMDKQRLDQLSMEKSVIGVEMKNELMGKTL